MLLSTLLRCHYSNRLGIYQVDRMHCNACTKIMDYKIISFAPLLIFNFITVPEVRSYLSSVYNLTSFISRNWQTKLISTPSILGW